MKLIPLFISLFILLGCGGSDNNNNSQPDSSSEEIGAIETPDDLMQAMVSKGNIPDLDKENSLSGIDANANGVRDDIENFISRSSLTDGQKSVALDIAKSLQSIQTIETLTEESAATISMDTLYSISCFMDQFDNPADAYEYLQKLEAYNANTYERAKRYNEFNSIRDGSVTRHPKNVDC